jgi:hypothetical protein
MSTETKKVFKVLPSQPLNNESYLPCIYMNRKTGQWTWLSDTDRVGTGEKIPEKGIKMLAFNKRFPSYIVELDPNAPESMQKIEKAKIDFFKSFDRIAQSMGDGTVNSFPSDNHKLVFSDVYQNGLNKDTALGFDRQQFLFVDEDEIENLSLRDHRNKRNLSMLLDSISNNVPVMTSVCYMLGINPFGLDNDGIELALTRAVIEGGRDNEFKNIMETQKFGDTFLLYTNIAIVKGTIPQSESGYYQFNGSPIAKSIPEVAKHFEMIPTEWTALKLELKSIGVNIDESKMTKKATPAKAEAPVVHSSETV